MDFDRAVVMGAGTIAEIGPPGDLMGKEHGMFRTLVDRACTEALPSLLLIEGEETLPPQLLAGQQPS